MSTRPEPDLLSRSRIEAERDRRVLRVTRGLAATLGADFFQSAVKHLAGALRADWAYIGELTGTPIRGIRTLALAWFPGHAFQ
jgi:hypothetical protein